MKLLITVLTVLLIGGCSLMPDREKTKQGLLGLALKDQTAELFVQCVSGTELEPVVAKPYNRILDITSKYLPASVEEIEALLGSKDAFVDYAKSVAQDGKADFAQLEVDWKFIEVELARSDLQCPAEMYQGTGYLKTGYLEVKRTFLLNEKLVKTAKVVDLMVRISRNPGGEAVKYLIESAIPEAEPLPAPE